MNIFCHNDTCHDHVITGPGLDQFIHASQCDDCASQEAQAQEDERLYAEYVAHLEDLIDLVYDSARDAEVVA